MDKFAPAFGVTGNYVQCLRFRLSNPTVNQLLEPGRVPDGVVFELLSWGENTWQWAAPMITNLGKQLQAKFPDIDVAVVSHGGEQFQLTRQRKQQQSQAITQLTELSKEGVNLHVCGTHSYWQGVADSDYIDIVDVFPDGPAQINNYKKLGYTHILLQRSQ